MKKLAKTLLGLGLAVTLPISAAMADLNLRKDIRIDAAVVKMSDVFTGAGEFSGEALMEAPAPGRSLSVSVSTLKDWAGKYGLQLELPAYQRAVRIQREGYSLTGRDLANIFRRELGSNLKSTDVVRINGSTRNLMIAMDADIHDVEIEDFTYNEGMGRFSARLALPAGLGHYIEKTVSGNIESVRSVPVLNRAMQPGEIIREADLTWLQIPERSLPSGYITSSSDIVGMAARRGARPDKPLRTRDLVKPVVVAKNRMVGMRFTNGAVELIAVGRALENGGEGDMIRVMNTRSKQTVTALVVNQNLVEIVTPQMLARQLAEAR